MNTATSPGLSIQQLTRAPHRLMFFIGASNLLLAMLWWSAWLTAMRWPTLGMPQPFPYAGWLHAFIMQYQMLPSFMFGFLLTTFPRWTGQPDFARWYYLPIGVGIFGGQIATLLGALGWHAGILVGFWLTLAGWTTGLVLLALPLWRAHGVTWHALSCYSALLLGYIGLLAWGALLYRDSAWWAFANIKIGTFGLLLPIFLTVAHRMYPFFAGNVVSGYRPWRPPWLLGAFWVLCLAHLGLELMHMYERLWWVDLPMLALTATMLWRWWPRGPKPGLLTVLFIALAWLPLTFALYTGQSLAYAATGIYWLGRAPAHALFIGFFASTLIAMVTRVTQGHAGRPLTMPATAWFAFAAIQLVALLRVVAEIAPDPLSWEVLAAIGWLVAFAPWVLRVGGIWLSPRVDDRPG